jgi:hypothetical protein
MKKIGLFLVLCWMGPGIFAQDKTEEVNTGQDLTKPLSRFDIRYQYQHTTGNYDTNLMTLRLDAPVKLESGWLLSTRFDLPLVRNDIPSRDNPNGDYESGAGDLLTQFFLISPPQGRWAYAVGAQLIWPTASQDQMGTGKYQLAPSVATVYYPEAWSKGSFVGLLLRDYFDYAGDDDRADIHEMSIQPLFNYNLPERWFLGINPDIRVNWEQDNQWFVPFNVTLGKLINKSTVMSVEFNTPIVNDYDRYDWQIEFRIGFFF